MPTPILGLRTTIYKVADIEKAKAWYAGAFAATPTFEEPFYVGFNIARWSEFDMEARSWSIPAERMKAGRAHRIPLPDRAIEILERMRDFCRSFIVHQCPLTFS